MSFIAVNLGATTGGSDDESARAWEGEAQVRLPVTPRAARASGGRTTALATCADAVLSWAHGHEATGIDRASHQTCGLRGCEGLRSHQSRRPGVPASSTPAVNRLPPPPTAGKLTTLRVTTNQRCVAVFKEPSCVPHLYPRPHGADLKCPRAPLGRALIIKPSGGYNPPR